MALFRRRARAAPPGVPASVQRFWAWWDGAQGEVAAAVDDGDQGRLASLLTIPVREIHPDLGWHVGEGVRSRLMLVLSGARHPALRVITERWRRAGPADTPSWEYHPAMPAEPAAFEAMIQVAGIRLDPAEATALASVDDVRIRLDLAVHHPAFPQLDELARTRVANVLVGWALGDDDSDRWIGRITATELRPLDGVPVRMLAVVTTQLAGRWAGERWAVLEGTFGTSRLIAAVRHPLHRVDHPLFDEHLAVRLAYGSTLPDGQPGPESIDELEAFQRSFVARLGEVAVLVAIQTAGGERLLHFYADSATRPLPTFQTLIRGYAGGQASVQARFDPGWDAVDHLRIATNPG